MNNDNDLNLHSMTKLSGWLRYCRYLILFSTLSIPIEVYNQENSYEVSFFPLSLEQIKINNPVPIYNVHFNDTTTEH